VQEYEIRVLSSGHPIIIIDAKYFSDHAAVRSAKDLAQGRPFEVWRGLSRIYAPPKLDPEPSRRSSLRAKSWRL
jgi:hypothetical protein